MGSRYRRPSVAWASWEGLTSREEQQWAFQWGDRWGHRRLDSGRAKHPVGWGSRTVSVPSTCWVGGPGWPSRAPQLHF